MEELISNCCGARVEVATSRYEDRPSHWCVCQKCKEPCDTGKPTVDEGEIERRARIQDVRESMKRVDGILARVLRREPLKDIDGIMVRRLIRLLVEEWV